VGLLFAAWEHDFGGIRTAVETFWDVTGKPIFDQLKTWLETNIPVALQAATTTFNTVLLPALNAVWNFIKDNVIPILGTAVIWLRDNVPPAIQKLTDFWNTTLLPALNAIWNFIKDNLIPILGTVVTWLRDNIPPAIQTLSDFWNLTLLPALTAVQKFINEKLILAFAGVQLVIGGIEGASKTLKDFWNDTLQPAMVSLYNYVTTTLGPGLAGMQTLLGDVKGWFEGIGTAVSGVYSWVVDLWNKLDAIEIPDWLQGQSPPPMANWLNAIGDSAAYAGASLGGMQMPLAGSPGGGVGGVGGGRTYNQQRSAHVTINQRFTSTPPAAYNGALVRSLAGV